MRIVVIGAGIMGSGIAQVAAMAGHQVVMVDLDGAALGRAWAAVGASLERFVKSERLTRAQSAATADRLESSTDLNSALAGAQVVVEAVPEVWELKEAVLAIVRDYAPADALLATNTSQLSITQLSTILGDGADRFVGMHFFNPPVRMQLLELVVGLRTSEDTVRRAKQFAETLDKEVVVCRKDSPGFITTRAYAALRQECMRMLEEGLASVEDIDTALKLGFNFPMGPFELSDFNGVDTYFHVISQLEKVHGERFRPTPILRNMVAAGRLGRKAGAGFYEYGTDGAKGEML